MRFLTCLSLLVVLMLRCNVASHAESVGEKWVVVVGVAYGRPIDAASGVAALRNTVSDAQEFVRFLHAPSDHVLALYDAPERPQTQRPTRQRILETLKQQLTKAGPNDTFWFYFSGHGILMNGRSYLAPADLTLGNPGSLLAVGDLRKLLAENCRARVKILVLDACQSGSAKRLPNFGDNDNNEPPDASTTAGNVVTLAACRVNQFAYEVPGMGGLFTYYLMRGLNGDSGKASRTVTLADLRSYVTRELEREYRERPLDSPQEPVFFVPDGVSTLPLAARNDDALHDLDDRKNNNKAHKIEPLKPGVIVTVMDEEGRSTADTDKMERRLRATLRAHGVPLVPEKEVEQYLNVFHEQGQDQAAKDRLKQMGSRFLLRCVLKIEAGPETVAGVALQAFRLYLDIETLDVNGELKESVSLKARNAGRTPASAEENAYDALNDSFNSNERFQGLLDELHRLMRSD